MRPWIRIKGPLSYRVLVLALPVVFWAMFLSFRSVYEKDLSGEFSSINFPRLGIKYIYHTTSTMPPIKEYETYANALRSVADHSGQVILASADSAYIDMAENFYKTSILRFGITNFMLVCNDAGAYKEALQRNIPAYLIDRRNDGEAKQASSFGTEAFRRKTHFKTDLVLSALRVGVTVLLVDVDIVFLRNPLRYVSLQGGYDIAIQDDTVEVNSGFYLVKPSVGGIMLHARSLGLARIQPELSNQKTLTRTLNSMVYHNTIKPRYLSVELFPNGQRYFEGGRRMLPEDNPCSHCLIVHNNWITGQEAKIFRFREHGLWLVDGNGYYSNPERKYITYSNPIFLRKMKTRQMEDNALYNALLVADILNRTLILPRFHCDGCTMNCEILEDGKSIKEKRCLANLFYRIDTLFKYFKVRESLFLKHDLVPMNVKLSISPIIQIFGEKIKQLNISSFQEKDDIVFYGGELITEQEIRKWLSPYAEKSIIRFGQFYSRFKGYENDQENNVFQSKIYKGIKNGNYRQYSFIYSNI